MFFSDRSENHEKLEGFQSFYQDEPETAVYKKFNFYTCNTMKGGIYMMTTLRSF